MNSLQPPKLSNYTHTTRKRNINLSQRANNRFASAGEDEKNYVNPTDLPIRLVNYMNRHPFFHIDIYLEHMIADIFAQFMTRFLKQKTLHYLTMKSPTMIIDCFFAFLLLCVFSSACSKNNKRDDVIDSMKERYEDWLTRHGRRYGKTEEWNLRFGIYQSNVVLIDFINSQNLSYKLTDNEFADMTNFEFQSLFMGYRDPRYSQVRYNSTCHDSEVPTSIDWRKQGAVTPVKNQGTCGSCWAFSTIAAVEGINKIKTGKLVSLSEQELLDCNYNEYNQGCDGGYMEKAFEYIKKNDGITTEKNYPYEGKRSDCNVVKEKDHVVTISGHVSVSRSDEKALQVAVAQQPVSVAIDAGGYDFQLYSSGIFSGYCGKELNHGVTVVGYGVENDNKFWLVKNSWGSSWGEEGYIKMKRDSSDKDGECGIALMASYPTKA